MTEKKTPPRSRSLTEYSTWDFPTASQDVNSRNPHQSSHFPQEETADHLK